jgi:predicted hotdog family 3-hydroxylacyl-ACP dehydratase
MKLPAISLPYPAEFLIPHRPPMLFVRQIIERKKDTALVDAIVPDEGIFFDQNSGMVLPELYIEIMAQAIATINGWDALNESTTTVRGFLVGMHHIEFNSYAKPGQTIWIELIRKLEFGEIIIFDGIIRTTREIVIQGEVKVWVDKNNNV